MEIYLKRWISDTCILFKIGVYTHQIHSSKEKIHALRLHKCYTQSADHFHEGSLSV